MTATTDRWNIRFDHIGVAVPEAAPVAAMLLDVLGGAITWMDRPAQAGRGYLATHVSLDGTLVELIEPDGPKSFVGRFIERRGAGLHHLTWMCDDLGDLVAHFERTGVRVIDIIRRNGEVVDAYVHPASGHGVLNQFRPGWWRGQDRRDQPQMQDLPPARPARGKIDHVTVAAPDRKEALAWFQTWLGGEALWERRFGDFYGGPLQTGRPGPYVGFIGPATPESFVAKFLADRGPGLHHLAFHLTDMEGALAAVEALGLRLIGKRETDGRVVDAFIHPSNPTNSLLRLTRAGTPPGEGSEG